MIRRFSREDSTDSGSSRYATRKRDDSDSFVSGVDPQWLFNCFFLPKVSRYLAKSRTSGALTSEPKEPTPEESASRRISGDMVDCFAVDEDNNANIYPRRAPVSEWAIEIRRPQGEKSPSGKEQEFCDDRARRWRRRRRRRCRRDSDAVHLPLWGGVGKISLFTHVEGNIEGDVVIEACVHVFQMFASNNKNQWEGIIHFKPPRLNL